jgi:superfamily II DNA or RNA helicase
VRVVVSNMAWLPKSELTPEQIVNLKNALTVVPARVGDHPGEDPDPFPIYQDSGDLLGVPREFYFERRRPTVHETVLRVTKGSLDDWTPIEFFGVLRSEQQAAVDEVVTMFNAGTLGGLVQAKPAFGKTVVALAIAARLKVPTLVVVHKEFLMDQWKERIATFLPGACVGYVQQDVCDFHGKTIVVGMVHSLASGRYSESFYSWPGLVITDESVGECALILTRKGWRTIGSLVGGADEIEALALDQRRGVFEWKKVSGRWRHPPKSPMCRITHEMGVLECTTNHEVLTPFGYRRAGELVPGVDCVVHGDLSGTDQLLREGEGVLDFYTSPSRVLRVDQIETPEFVYDLTVEDHHNFVVDGVVTHNCHRVSARTWSGVPGMFKARWRLGITATPRRKDGTDCVFWHHLGPILFAAKEARLTPTIKRVWTNFKLVQTDRFNPNLAPRHLIMRFLCASRYRNDVIVDQLVQALAKGRKCIVLSERLEHLDRLEACLSSVWPKEYGASPSVGHYVGGKTKAQLEESAKARVILATVQYCSEGLDIPELDTMFLTTPMSDVEQAVGRILRSVEGKRPPIVVDFRDDSIPMLEAMARKRDRYYESLS